MVSKLLAMSLLSVTLANAGPVEDERILNADKRQLLSGARIFADPAPLGERESRILVDAVEDLKAAGKEFNPPVLRWQSLLPALRARWFRLGQLAGLGEGELVGSLEQAAPEPALLYELLGQEALFRSIGAARLVRELEAALPGEARAFRTLKNGWAPPPPAEMRALFAELPDTTHFQNGAFANKPRLFLFCRHDRNYPCLLTLKDKDDQPVRNADGSLWTQPGLGLSGYGKPFNERLGNTPQGVHLVNSVMPAADDYVSFGKFRRMILEFPPASSGEAEMRKLLPAAAQGSLWWHESAIARDVGRGELRIHGTGAHNDRPDVLFYPFIATIGCVAQRELKYGSVEYADQRLLLDRMMRAQGLEAKFANEPAIRALLYVIDIDDRKAAVTSADLARLGIQ